MRRRPAPKRVQPAARKSLEELGETGRATQCAHQEVCAALGTILESGLLSDVTLIVTNRHINAHAAILAAGSRVFAAMFTNGMRETTQRNVELPDDDVDVIQALLRFLYTGEVMSDVLESDNTALALMLTAHKYEVPTLVAICSDAVSSKLDVESVADRLLVADQIGLDSLRQPCLEFISVHLAEVQSTSAYTRLVDSRPQLLRDILATVCPPSGGIMKEEAAAVSIDNKVLEEKGRVVRTLAPGISSLEGIREGTTVVTVNSL